MFLYNRFPAIFASYQAVKTASGGNTHGTSAISSLHSILKIELSTRMETTISLPAKKDTAIANGLPL